MAADYYTRTGDTDGDLQITCTHASGSAVNLTGTTCTAYYRKEGATSWSTASVTLVTAASGIVKVERSALTLSTAGRYHLYVEADFGATGKMSFPNSKPLIIHVS